MYNNAVVYRGKTWRYALFISALFVVSLALFTFWKQYGFSDILELSVYVALGFGIAFYYQAPHITVHIVVSEDTVAAPAPDSGRILKAASIHDIVLSQSRLPMFLRSGYLALRNGGRLMVPPMYYSAAEAREIFEQIARQQEAPISGEYHRCTGDRCHEQQ